MSLRSNNMDIDVDRASLAAAYPEPSSRLVLFVHGLCHDENAWTPKPDPATGLAGPSYADRLAQDTDVTPLLIRYNTGRHVSENGADLARLLDAAGRVVARPGDRPDPGRALDGRARHPQRLPRGRGGRTRRGWT